MSKATELIEQAFNQHNRDHTATPYMSECSNPLCQLAYWAGVDISTKVDAIELVQLETALQEARYLANFIVNNRRNFFVRDTDGVGNRVIDQLAAWLEKHGA
jgi:hypothetical protein